MKVLTLLVPALLVWSAIPVAAQGIEPGFEAADAAHHFVLNDNGGIISLAAMNPEDPTTPEAIRAHLARVAKAGIPELRRLTANITYTFEATQDGGQVWLRTTNLNALIAIHDYLRTQIEELRTGDSAEVQ